MLIDLDDFWCKKTCANSVPVLTFFVLRRLSSHLDNIKKTACGDGHSHCLLCGVSFGPQGVTAVLCVQCKKVGGCLYSSCLMPEDVQTSLHGQEFC